MKMIFLFLFLISNLNASRFSISEQNINNLTFTQLGNMTKRTDGPLKGKELLKALTDKFERDLGRDITMPKVVVQIPENLKNEQLGNTRINSENLEIIYPEHKNYNKYINNKNKDESLRNQIGNEIVSESEKTSTSLYPKIYQIDKIFTESDNKYYTKEILEDAVDREQEIYNQMIMNG
jgi:hypothetical protein